MATPQEYLDLVAAVNVSHSPALTLQLQKMLEAQPELADTNPKNPVVYQHHNTVMPSWPANFVFPRSEAELVKALDDRKNAYTSFRAMGDGYGFANAAATTGCLVRMAGMNDLLELQAENFRTDFDLDEDEYVRFEGGITVGKLNDALSATGRTMIQQPGFKDLTVVGCSGAGGHGSGFGIPGISGFIRALELVGFDANKNVKVRRIEPTNGMTDPAKYAAWKAKQPNPALYELVQDDVLFHSARCAQGHLGIISAATLQVTQKFQLKEDRWISTWAEAWPQVQQMMTNPSVHSVHVWINPYVTTKPSPTVLITRLTKTGQPPWGIRGLGILFGGKNVGTDLAALAAHNQPQKLGGATDFALSLCAKMDVVLRSTEAMDFGPPNELAVNAASMGFDASRADEVMQKLIPQLEAWKAMNNCVTSPIGMRWVAKSEDFLSPQYGRDTIMLEMPILAGTPNAVQTLDLYANFMMDTFGARPHWGQQNPMTKAQFAKNYADGLPKFLSAFKTLNPLGLFDGPLTKQLGLRELV
ncbi:MAG: D-arabinono-1,4-lactone oxidase [Myxococcaceae bacterium]